MFLGRVSGTVVSTIHHPFYDGRRLLVVDRVDQHLKPNGAYVLALDSVEAGAGELVMLIDEGNSSRQITGVANAPVRAVIVGVVDDVQVDAFGKQDEETT